MAKRSFPWSRTETDRMRLVASTKHSCGVGGWDGSTRWRHGAGGGPAGEHRRNTGAVKGAARAGGAHRPNTSEPSKRFGATPPGAARPTLTIRSRDGPTVSASRWFGTGSTSHGPGATLPPRDDGKTAPAAYRDFRVGHAAHGPLWSPLMSHARQGIGGRPASEKSLRRPWRCPLRPGGSGWASCLRRSP